MTAEIVRPAGRVSLGRVMLASAIGSALEWYDFFIYGTAAALVFNELSFPKLDPRIGTLAAFATFGVGFFARRWRLGWRPQCSSCLERLPRHLYSRSRRVCLADNATKIPLAAASSRNSAKSFRQTATSYPTNEIAERVINHASAGASRLHAHLDLCVLPTLTLERLFAFRGAQATTTSVVCSDGHPRAVISFTD